MLDGGTYFFPEEGQGTWTGGVRSAVKQIDTSPLRGPRAPSLSTLLLQLVPARRRPPLRPLPREISDWCSHLCERSTVLPRCTLRDSIRKITEPYFCSCAQSQCTRLHVGVRPLSLSLNGCYGSLVMCPAHRVFLLRLQGRREYGQGRGGGPASYPAGVSPSFIRISRTHARHPGG